ncbi:MAG: hypothetical protein IKP73_16925 [Bacteroidales bacterium]|jgi:uncharacterized membrane protein YheB (UPF0754 family)|nr:hypothetical protein [Bacteroidales bacterium]
MDIYAYILIPLISAVIGYVTNVIAIKMTFYPLDYKGIRPFLGWQGIIPSKATKMAEKSVDLLTRDLFKPKDVFARLDVSEIIRISTDNFLAMSRRIADAVLTTRVPMASTAVGRSVKPHVENAVAKVLPGVVGNAMLRIKDNIEEILNLKAIAVEALKEDKSLINKIFLDLGGKQFRFIETSGAWLGFLFGLGQIVTCMYTSHWLMFVAYGIFIGYITNVLAIKMIFEPAEPKKIGPFLFWGLFLRNQRAESFKYADIISSRILTPEKLFDYIFRSPDCQLTRQIMEDEVSKAVDEVVRSLPSLVKLVLTNQKISELKSVAVFNLMNELPLYISVIYPYTEQTLDIRNTIGSKMSELPPKKFIDFLRPAFQEDEWKLIAVGAVLGGVAGFLQSLLGAL